MRSAWQVRLFFFTYNCLPPADLGEVAEHSTTYDADLAALVAAVTTAESLGVSPRDLTPARDLVAQAARAHALRLTTRRRAIQVLSPLRPTRQPAQPQAS